MFGEKKKECAALFFFSIRAWQFLSNLPRISFSVLLQQIMNLYSTMSFLQIKDSQRAVLLMRLGASHSLRKPWVQSEVSPSGICGEQTGTGTGFSPGTSAFPYQYHSTNISYPF